MFFFPSIGLILAGEFTSLDEPTEVSNVAATMVFPVDGLEGFRSKRRREPTDPTQKLKLSILVEIKTGARVGRCG
jgi:hypothetical protein